ncbi:MAG: hypothetical protein LUF04_09275 [Bacteroides sp.]|nr:hypothetical protein [Bacteroides sp.]
MSKTYLLSPHQAAGTTQAGNPDTKDRNKADVIWPRGASLYGSMYYIGAQLSLHPGSRKVYR